MTPSEWQRTCDHITDEMKVHTRAFTTPLGTETSTTIRLTGTGSYVQHEGRRLLLTCEHVAREGPVHYRLHDSKDVFEHCGSWITDPHPIDAATAVIADEAWHATAHQAAVVPYRRFANRHRTAQQAELLFFRGFAGENARYAFEVHETNASGYSTQERADSGDEQIFELFWDPQQTRVTAGTEDEARAAMKWDDPGGFSGSLVWNTRYLEVQDAGGHWKPEDAVFS